MTSVRAELSDRTSVSPSSADVRATAAVSPAAAVATNSIASLELSKCDCEQASAEQGDSSSGDGKVSLSNDVSVGSVSTHDTPVGSAPTDGADELIKDFGIAGSAALPQFGAPGDQLCIGDIDPDLEASITALEVSWLRAGIVMNAATLATIAASESFSNSTSLVKA